MVKLPTSAKAPATIVRRYGAGSFLAVLSLPIAWLMASRGMNGWQQAAFAALERDCVDMWRRGYRLVSSEEHALPFFGIAYYTAVYERQPSAAAVDA